MNWIGKANYNLNLKYSLKNTMKNSSNKLTICHWNANGLYARINDGSIYKLLTYLGKHPSLVLCITETKISEKSKNRNEVEIYFKIQGYNIIFNPASPHGGTAVISKEKISLIRLGFGKMFSDNDESRLLIVECMGVKVMVVYAPSVKTPTKISTSEERYKFKTGDWHREIMRVIEEESAMSEMVICGDFNVARDENDLWFVPVLKKDKVNYRAYDYFDSRDRKNFEEILEKGYIDIYREMNPDKKGGFTAFDSRIPGAASMDWKGGRRLDYILPRRGVQFEDFVIDKRIRGSDHFPIYCTIDFSNETEVEDDIDIESARVRKNQI